MAPELIGCRLVKCQDNGSLLWGNDLRWTAEEGLGQGWRILGDGSGGYGSDLRNLSYAFEERGPHECVESNPYLRINFFSAFLTLPEIDAEIRPLA